MRVVQSVFLINKFDHLRMYCTVLNKEHLFCRVHAVLVCHQDVRISNTKRFFHQRSMVIVKVGDMKFEQNLKFYHANLVSMFTVHALE